MMGSMRNWLKGEASEEGHGERKREPQREGRVVVVHCKAGKGRSGTVSCSYLISEEGWTVEDALKRFTERRMRPGFGAGVSIPSQLRWVGYVDRWTKHGKLYLERPVEVLELHVWGLRDGVKASVEGYVEEGRKIKSYHTFQKTEREQIRGTIKRSSGFTNMIGEVITSERKKDDGKTLSNAPLEQSQIESPMNDVSAENRKRDELEDGWSGDTVFRPKERIILETNDINIDFERRNKASYSGFTMVTAVAHVWFNVYFEGKGPENNGKPEDSGVFEIEWDAMDGIKGSSRKGTRAFDKMAVVWKSVVDERKASIVINEPSEAEGIKQMSAADWRGANEPSTPGLGSKDLGLRAQTPTSATVSRANSIGGHKEESVASDYDDMDGVKSYGADGETHVEHPNETERPKSLLPTSAELPGPTHSVEPRN